MLLYEYVRLQDVCEQKRDRHRHRLSARQLRAQMRQRRRAEYAIMEMRWSRLC